MSSRKTEQVHDPRVLRAIAHPVRNRILNELAAGGPMRAADVAREMGIPANQASFHLRQLAKYGLVEEAPEEARDKRDRVWRMVSPGGLRLDLREMEGVPGGRAATQVWERSAVAWMHHVVDVAFSDLRDEDVSRVITNQPIRLTKDEAKEFAAELDDVMVRWSERTRGRDESRRTYLLTEILQPYPEDPMIGGDPDEGAHGS